MEASVPLVIVMGVVTTAAAFWMMRRDMRNGTWRDGLVAAGKEAEYEKPVVPSDNIELPHRMKQWLAALIPLLFIVDLAAMFLFRLQGGDATALIGGTAVIILIAVTVLAHGNNGLEQTTVYLIDGFQFGFKVFGPVIPIAAFFYLGDSAFTEIFGRSLPEGSHGIVNDLGVALANHVPLNQAVSAVTLTVTGAITGLDGSGFSGISLAGSIAQLFAGAIGSGAATLTALGQVAAIWVGGGTLIPWALIPAAAICGVSPFELARRNLRPVLIGLAVTTITAMFLI
jgi:NADH:ubiquinone oxidoreductase subunit 3 (subunit A)